MNTLPQITHQLDIVTRSAAFNAHYSLPHVGDYKFSARPSDFNGWLKCDGRSLNITDYSALYEIIGTSFGGGEGTFTLPDLRGRVPGAIGTSTAANHVLGETIGHETHTLTINEMPSHDHGGSTGAGGFAAATADPAVSLSTMGVADNTGSHTHTISPQGGGQPHNNMQPTLYIGSLFIFSGTRYPSGNPVLPDEE